MKGSLEGHGPEGGATARRTLSRPLAQRLRLRRAYGVRGSSRRIDIMMDRLRLGEATHEYQVDSPSSIASPSGPWPSRAGPRKLL